MDNGNYFRVEFSGHPEFDTTVFAPDAVEAINYVKADPLYKMRFPHKGPEMRATFIKRAGVS